MHHTMAFILPNQNNYNNIIIYQSGRTLKILLLSTSDYVTAADVMIMHLHNTIIIIIIIIAIV